ncbi:hypothetical protein SAMN05421747_11614 [Parapedobacter composti]|uniref:Uncharacterized protein n=1 Tax=Parapedobacter composti TaxID=623281 RepID=A0A1I1KQS9_9SPHI|nr:hypothetical protein SAMN05421747_11614 [Parapedobacter composti]
MCIAILPLKVNFPVFSKPLFFSFTLGVCLIAPDMYKQAGRHEALAKAFLANE